MLFYFTATGNSLYAAKCLDAKPISIAKAIHDKNKVYADERIGIVCPIYGHEMPALVKDFLRSSQFRTGYFYIILTYGKFHGGAAELARAYAGNLGIQPSYINVVLMADNYLPAFDMEEEKKLDKDIDKQLSIIKHDIAAKKVFFSPVTEQDREIHRKFEDYRNRNQVPDLFRITDECIGCGICSKVCPMKCFRIENQKSMRIPDGCISCMACIHACPMKAIALRIPEKNPRARYRNENISLCELIEANNQMEEESRCRPHDDLQAERINQ